MAKACCSAPEKERFTSGTFGRNDISSHPWAKNSYLRGGSWPLQLLYSGHLLYKIEKEVRQKDRWALDAAVLEAKRYLEPLYAGLLELVTERLRLSNTLFSGGGQRPKGTGRRREAAPARRAGAAIPSSSH